MTENKLFLKNVGIVSLGPIIAAMVGFFAEPWISRLWGPELYGLGAYFHSVLQIIVPAMFLRYNFAIVQAADFSEAANLLALSLLVFTAFFILVALAYPIFGSMMGDSFPFESYKGLFLIALAAGSIATLLRFWASHHKRFGLQTLSTITLQIVPVALLLVWGFQGSIGEAQMIKVRSIAYISYPLLLIMSFLWQDVAKVWRNVSWLGIKAAAKKFVDYPRHEYLGFLANLLAFNLPVILIARYWGTATSGLYAKAFTIMYMFVLLLGDSVNRVLHKEAADMVNGGKDLAPFIDKVLRALVYLSLLPFILLMLVGPELFSVFLGELWLVSGQFAQAMALWSFANLLNLSLLPLYGVLNRQRQYTRFTLATLALRALILILMGMAGTNVILALAVFSVANVVVLMWQTVYISGCAGVNIKESLVFILKRIMEMLPLVAIFLLIKHISGLGPLPLIACVILLSLPYVYKYYIRNLSLYRNVF
ncbi:MAG: oligosaccharide flippase family protein [Candidatus Cloacimonetes bacterium]|nr:oligosaccharide flippase family protein [Candidatus Cloacimonadota bacterium]